MEILITIAVIIAIGSLVKIEKRSNAEKEKKHQELIDAIKYKGHEDLDS